MGARINFVFKQGDGLSTVLYSHWGEDTWSEDLAAALYHARFRKGDVSYYIRNAISYLIAPQIMEETGFGIYAVKDEDYMFGDTAVIIDLAAYTVEDDTGTHDIDKFINYHMMEVASVNQA